MSAMLNFVGLATLLVMSAALLGNAGIPVGSLVHMAESYLGGMIPAQVP
jgi:hypothetical protein